MNPAKVDRRRLARLEDLPNIGKAMAADLRRLGVLTPEDLKGWDPLALFERLCGVTGRRLDPCVLDVFLSVTRFMDGGQPLPWWAFTQERRQLLACRPPA